MNFINCPRCGEKSYEKLMSHDHCVNCNYSSEFDNKYQIPEWAKEEAKCKNAISKIMKPEIAKIINLKLTSAA